HDPDARRLPHPPPGLASVAGCRPRQCGEPAARIPAHRGPPRLWHRLPGARRGPAPAQRPHGDGPGEPGGACRGHERGYRVPRCDAGLAHCGAGGHRTARRGCVTGCRVRDAGVARHSGPTETVPVSLEGPAEGTSAGIESRAAILASLTAAQEASARHAPERILTLGGECALSVAPFAAL